MLLAAGLLYQSEIGVDGVGREDSHYQLNDNGVLFVHFGLGVEISQYIKSGAPLEVATDNDIKNMWYDAVENAKLVMNDEIYIEQTAFLLHCFVNTVKTLGKLNLHDLNIYAEYFFRDFLNELYDWNLVNANDITFNEPGIDLVDNAANIAVQVSVTTTKDKVQSSIDKTKKSRGNDCHFYFLALTSTASKLRTKKYDIPSGIRFNPVTDVIDIDSLVKSMQAVTIETKQNLYELALHHLSVLSRPEKNQLYLSTVVEVLAGEMKGNDMQSNTVAFIIPEKIRLNGLDKIKDSISEHAEYTAMLNKIYETNESLGRFVRMTIHSSLRKVYEDNKDKMSSDALYRYISDFALNKVLESANRPKNMNLESIAWCVDVIVTDAFEACKIFEHPMNIQ